MLRSARLTWQLLTMVGFTNCFGCSTWATAPHVVPLNTVFTTPHACAGLAEKVRHTPLLSPDMIVHARELRSRRGKQLFWYTDGAELYLRAQQGENAAWIARVAHCQASIKVHSASSPNPLAVAGAEISVSRAGSTHAIKIVAREQHQALEIVRRVSQLRRIND